MQLYNRALVIEQAHYGPQHPEVALTLGNMGVTAREQVSSRLPV